MATMTCCPILMGLTEPASYKYRMPNRAFEPTVTPSRFDNTSLAVSEFESFLGPSEPLYQVLVRGGPKHVNVFGRVESFNSVETDFYTNWTDSSSFTTEEPGEWPNLYESVIAPSGLRDDSVQKFLPFTAPKDYPANQTTGITLDTAFQTVSQAHLTSKVNKMAFYGAVFVTEMTGTSTTATVVSGRKSALTVADPGDLTTWDHPDYTELMATPKEYIAPEEAYQDAMFQYVGPPILCSQLDPPTVDKSSGHTVWSQDFEMRNLGQVLTRKHAPSTNTSTLNVYSLFEGIDYHMNNVHAGMRLTFTEDLEDETTINVDMGAGYSVRCIWFIGTKSSNGNQTIAPYARVFNTAGSTLEIPFEAELGFFAPAQIQVTRLMVPSYVHPNTWDPTVLVKLDFLRRESSFMTAARLPLSFIKWENLQKEAHLIRRLEVGYEGVTTAVKRDVDYGSLPPVSKISKEALVSSAIHTWNDMESPFAYTLNTKGVANLINESPKFSTMHNVGNYEAGFWKTMGKIGKGILSVGKHIAGPLMSRFPLTAPYASTAHAAINEVAKSMGAARYSQKAKRRNVDAMYDEDDNIHHDSMMDAASYHLQKLRR